MSIFTVQLRHDILGIATAERTCGPGILIWLRLTRLSAPLMHPACPIWRLGCKALNHARWLYHLGPGASPISSKLSLEYIVRYSDQRKILMITRQQISAKVLQHTCMSFMSRWLQRIVSLQPNPDTFGVQNVFRTQTGRPIAKGS